MDGRPNEPDGRFQNVGIPEAEARAETLKEQIDALAVPDGLHPVDLYKRSEELLKASVQLRQALGEMNSMLARLRNQIAVFLGEVERQLLLGQVNSDVWERNRSYVDTRLAQIAPQMVEQFSAAYRRHAEDDAEARSHALTSCRRALKTLADVLYPASNEQVQGIDGRERKMTDDKFVSRLFHDRPPRELEELYAVKDRPTTPIT